jgi:hypothetical protein
MDLAGWIGTAVGLAGLVMAAWQLRVAVAERRPGPSDPPENSAEGALPVVAPFGRLPAELLGRDDLIAELATALKRRRAGTPGVWVLTGLGGTGKSTIALRLATLARASGRTVWWVNAGDPVSLRGGLLEILRQADAPSDVMRAIRDGRPTAAGQFWEFLSTNHKPAARFSASF